MKSQENAYPIDTEIRCMYPVQIAYNTTGARLSYCGILYIFVPEDKMIKISNLQSIFVYCIKTIY